LRPVCLLLAAAALAQELPRIRITVNLVQVDAVVTDAAGRHISGLTAGDFEIFQDGKRQRITAFSYVPGSSIAMPATASPARDETVRTEAARGVQRPAGRVIALVVDDLGLSAQSIYQTRSVLTDFVENRLQPGDLAAIVSTSGGVGVLQQLTSDKARLAAAVERLRPQFGRSETDAMPSVLNSEVTVPRADLAVDRGQAYIRRMRQIRYTLASLGALNLIVRGLRELPGRKSVVLFSENIETFQMDDPYSVGLLDAARNVTDMANRSSAVVDVIDPRGVVHTGAQAADDRAATSTGKAIEIERITAYQRSMEGLAWLAEQTGGLFIRGDNQIRAGLQRALADKEGYYLIGYVPGSEAFQKTRNGTAAFHNLRLRLKRRGLQLRYRHGFFGVPDEEGTERRPRLEVALLSPFASAEVRVKLTPVFGQDAAQGPYISSLLHIDGRDLRFTEEAGQRKIALRTVVATLDENGRVTGRTSQPLDVPVDAAQWEKFQKQGLVYAVAHYVKKAGQYQLRAAVEDRSNGRIGSAASFVEVPDAGHLTLSGILLGSAEAMAAADIRDTAGTPAVRIFKPGTALRCEMEVLNAQQPVVTQMKIYRQGKEFYSGARGTLAGADSNRIRTVTRYTLPPGMSAGEYVLEMLVTDATGTARRAIDFEVAR